MLRVGIIIFLCSLACGAEVYAQQTSPPQHPQAKSDVAPVSRLKEVVVPGERPTEPSGLSLETPTPTGSRLGLTPREIPASVDVIGQETIEERGHRSTLEAIESAVGVTAGSPPGDPGAFSLRGFTDNQISQLYDGTRIGPSNMTGRPLDVWNFERIEILKGPASVLYGEGAVGGAINLVTRRPNREERRHLDAFFSYGRFNSTRFGLGSGGSLYRDKLFYRVDLSRNSSDGFINHTPSEFWNLTSSVLFDVNERFSLQASFDTTADDVGSYWGTPLVPRSFATKPLFGVVKTRDGRTIDRRMSRVNYNVADSRMWAHTYWGRVNARWQMSNAIALHNEFYLYQANRRWRNAETYAFDPTTLLVNRDRFFVAHDQRILGNRGELHYTHAMFGQHNRMVLGFDISRLDFGRPGAFCCDDPDGVDPFRPTRGRFGSLTPTRQQTDIDTRALFFEDHLLVAERLHLVAGVRAEWIDLDRKLFRTDKSLNTGPSFVRTFAPVTWRLGAVFDLFPTLSLYSQYSTAADPVGTNIFLVRENQNFDLTHGRQWEVGLKYSGLEGRAEWTLAYFDITRKNILTQTSLTAAVNVGRQSSHGVEFAAAVRPTPAWRLQGNVAYLDAEFDNFAEPSGDTLVSRAGNVPPNVPRLVANLWTSYRVLYPWPLEVGGGIRHVGNRFTDTANSIKLLSYATVDAFLSWPLGESAYFKNSRLTVRARNLLDEDYAIWGDTFYPSQILRGEPRTVEFSLSTRFEGF